MDLRAAWFDKIQLITNHWDRKSESELILWFSGYRTQEAFDAETELRKLGGLVLAYDWHPICGKTAMILREPKEIRDAK